MSVWRCSFETTRAGTTVVNTFHQVYRPAGVVETADANEIRDALTAALNTKYRAVLTVSDTLNSLTVREELAPGDTSIPREAVATIGLAGTRAAPDATLPLGLCQLVTIRTNAAVRSGHGRLFMPPAIVAATLGSAGTWNPAGPYHTAITAFMNELNSNHDLGVLGVDGHLATIVYSRTRRARGDADYYFDMTGYVQRLTPHWLRSRMTAP